MRKTIILAFATTLLAGVTVVTDLVRTASGPVSNAISASSVVHAQTTGSLKARTSNAI